MAPIVVASFADAMAVAENPGGVIFVEHGAGQTYTGDAASADHGSYAGGAGLGNVGLFLSPREEVADRWRARYPAATAVAVGCPKMDKWADHPRSDTKTIGWTWHWNCGLIPETMSAEPYYNVAAIVPRLRSDGWEVLGHAHPKDRMGYARWSHLGVEVVGLDDLYARASTLLCDNSSVMYEFLAWRGPVIALNSPLWRRDVFHGLRFWDWPAAQIDDSRALEVFELLHEPAHAWGRGEALRVLGHDPSRPSAAERAYEAIVAWMETR